MLWANQKLIQPVVLYILKTYFVLHAWPRVSSFNSYYKVQLHCIFYKSSQNTPNILTIKLKTLYHGPSFFFFLHVSASQCVELLQCVTKKTVYSLQHNTLGCVTICLVTTLFTDGIDAARKVLLKKHSGYRSVTIQFSCVCFCVLVLFSF